MIKFLEVAQFRKAQSWEHLRFKMKNTFSEVELHKQLKGLFTLSLVVGLQTKMLSPMQA